MGCIIRTEQTDKLAKAFPQLSEIRVRNFIGMWQEANNKSNEEYPLATELNKFINKILNKKAVSNRVETTNKSYKREEVESQTDKVFLYADNTKDRLANKKATKTGPTALRGLDNTIGIDIKKTSSWREEAYFTDDDFDEFKAQVDEAIQTAIDSNKQIVIPKRYFNNTQFKQWSPKCYQYLQDKLESLSYKPTEVEKLNEATYTIPKLTTVGTQEKIDLLFDSITRRNRVSIISRLFYNEVQDMMEEEKRLLQNKIDNAESQEEREEYESQLSKVDEIYILNKYTPRAIFDSIKEVFTSYIDSTPEQQAEEFMFKFRKKKSAHKYTEEQLYKRAQEKAEYKLQEYLKIVDDEVYRALCEEASPIVGRRLGISLDVNYNKVSEETKDDDYNEEDEEDKEKTHDNEESPKDGWMSKFRQTSQADSLSKRVREVLSTIPRLNFKNKYDFDDLGFQQYLDAEYVHATLIDALKYMTSPQDMMKLLEKTAIKKRWVKQIINKLNEDELFKSAFYQDMRKDYVQYWAQRIITKANGTILVRTVSLNKPEGTYYLIDSWRDNYEGGILLDEDSIYDSNSNIIEENAKKGNDLIHSIMDGIIGIESEYSQKGDDVIQEKIIEYLSKPEVFNTIMKLYHMVGIDITENELDSMIINPPTKEGYTTINPVNDILYNLGVIFEGIYRKKEVRDEKKNGEFKRGDLINTYGGAYNKLALEFNKITNDAIESSIREGNKTYYAHNNPNYMNKILKRLKNVMNDKEQFEEFMQKEYKQYEWFFKDGEWLNSWLKDLYEDEDARKLLDHKVLLHCNKVEYADWDSLDYTTILLNEYFSAEDKKYAWYHIPILSDSQSAEFIKFKRYISDPVGKKYDDIILDKLVNVVIQEYNRIMLVRKRHEEYLKNPNKIQQIANYDIIGDNIGGAEFKFLPALNNVMINDKSFLDKLDELKDGSATEFTNFIKKNLMDVMENEFEATYRHWRKIGLLDETEEGKCKYINLSSESSYRNSMIRNLEKAQKILGDRFNLEMLDLLNKLRNNDNLTTKNINKIVNDIKNILSDMVSMGELDQETEKSISRYLSQENYAKDGLREYFWNSTLATSQIIQIMTTDLAFYKNIEDFQKRFKEIYSPALRLNTEATYKGEKVGKTIEKTLYLKDVIEVSNVYNEIKEIVDAKYKAGELSKIDRDYILSQYKKVNVADAQAYRTLKSYRDVMIMSGQWNDESEEAYNHLNDGNWSIKDFTQIWQTIKPFVYTQIKNEDGVGGKGIKTPVQHKNSEFLLLSMYGAINNSLGSATKLKALNEYMDKRGIDVVQFESTTKVGGQGIVSLDDVTTKDQLFTKLDEVTGFKDGNINPNVIHEIPYEDYGIQMQTPEHIIDTYQLVGTQIRKLIAADISDDAEIEFNGKKLTKKQWVDLYNKINTENIIQAFIQVDKSFSNPKNIEKLLLDTIRGNDRYGVEMQRACTLDENGLFTLPLYDQVQSLRVQSLINSIIKSKITKQKIKGGALIQVSSYGLSDDLKIVFDGEGKDKRIKYMEVYMPAYSKDFYEPLMNKETGQLDINKLPEELRKAVGYRIPTESKYSMIPIYIKGFLPQQNGSAIMLPKEITTISGSDFDIDKLYVMLPEFTITNKYDKESFANEVINQNLKGNKNFEVIKQYREDILDAMYNGKDSDNESKRQIYELWQQNKRKYIIGKNIRKVEYDFNKESKDNSLKARNNLMIDMMYGVLTNKDTASKVLKPGGFANLKNTTRIINILNSVSPNQLKKVLTDNGVQINNNKKVLTQLFNLDYDTLDKIASKTKKRLNMLNPTTQVYLHQQNMTGAKLIGIYANANANNAIMQFTNLAINGGAAFTLNGKTLTSLHNIKNIENEYISDVTASFLAASVDNVKDPVLAALFQNLFTVSPSMLLARLGYNSLEIGLLMNQPIIKEIAQEYFRGKRKGLSKDNAIDKVIKKYQQLAKEIGDITYTKYKDNRFDIETLADNIMRERQATIDRTKTEDAEDMDWYSKQLAVGILFKNIMKVSNDLDKVVRATRYDSQNNAAGASIAETEVNAANVHNLLSAASKKSFTLTGIDFINEDIFEGDYSEENLRDKLYNSRLPYVQAFYSLGVEAIQYLLKDYFMQYNPNVRSVVKQITDLSINGRLDAKTINNIYNDLVSYIFTKTKFFGKQITGRGDNRRIVDIRQKRLSFITNFPQEFQRLKEENPKLADIEFIKRLKIKRSDEYNPVPTLIFKNVGRLTTNLRERYTRDWASLLYNPNPEIHKLSLNLFRYSFYRNGFSFSPNSFIHLAPVIVRLNIPEYVKTLRDMLNSKDDYSLFVDQYILNHLNNSNLVLNIPEESTFKFINDNGDIADEINITIDDNANYADKKIVKSEVIMGDQKEYILHNYIHKKIKGKDVYYRLSGQLSNNEFTYERIEPLGYPHCFIEYEYGVEANSIKTVFYRNQLNHVTDRDNAFSLEGNIDYSTMPEQGSFDDYLSDAYGYNTESENIDTIEDDKSKKVEITDDVFWKKMSELTGIPLRKPIDSTKEDNSKDMLNIQPAEDYKDADDDSICGAKKIFEF